jgi:uncharacterized protein (TIGR02246 family)
MTLSVADRLEILDIITRADQAASDRDAEAYVRLFTEDAVLDGAQGRHAGRDALRAAVGPVWAAEGPATLHLTLNPVIEDQDDDRGRQAAVRSVLLIVAPGPPATIRTAAPITQVLVRRNGSWNISRRTVGALGAAHPSSPSSA